MAEHVRVTVPMLDEVAKRLTEGDASADLRARVLERLPPITRVVWYRSALLNGGIAACVAALVIAGVLWSRHDAAPEVSPAVASTARLESSPAQNTVGVATNISSIPRRPARTHREEVTIPKLPALEAPEALAMETIQPQRLSIAQLTVAPLVTEPLRVAGTDGGSER